MAKPILIVGGGPAGLAAAHSLATFGQECILVDKEDRFGGAPILEGYAKLVPSGEWAKDAIGGMVDRAVGHELVDARPSTSVTAFNGEAGDFTALDNSAQAEAVQGAGVQAEDLKGQVAGAGGHIQDQRAVNVVQGKEHRLGEEPHVVPAVKFLDIVIAPGR